MDRDIYKYFRIEARDLADQLGRGALDLESGAAGPDGVVLMLRLAHTLKGAARVVKQLEIADLAHRIEDVLSPYRETARVPHPDVEKTLGLIDAIAPHLAALAAPKDASPARNREAPVEEPVQSLRADAQDLDGLLDGIAETYVQLASLGPGIEAANRVHQIAELLADQIDAPETRRTLNGAGLKIRALIAELRSQANVLQQGLPRSVEQISRELRQVRENAEQLRLARAGSMFMGLARLARDTAQSLGREVVFETKGAEVRLDAGVLGVVQNALIQAVRNAVAHGIESESERAAIGKSPKGRIAVEAARRGDRVAFSCRDDGRGVDLEAVRRAAERKGMASSEIRRLDRAELLRLLLASGISTTGQITELSGRGIGLDIVREAAVRLGGEATMRSEPQRGTALEIVVPVTLSSLEALIAQEGTHVAAIPLTAVRRVMRAGQSETVPSAEGPSILFDGHIVPFAPLSSLLGGSPARTSSSKSGSAIIVAGEKTYAAIGMDRVLGRETIVMRALPALAPADPVVAGAGLDPAGDPLIVLDPEKLVEAAHRRQMPEVALETHPPVLVIDDSVTTRMLEQSILETAGYEVDVASSGEEGLDKAHSKRFALFLVDIEMPGMDGFAFIERIRADPVLREIPAILISSRASPEDRSRGEAVGARAYIVKSEFNQSEFLAQVRTLAR